MPVPQLERLAAPVRRRVVHRGDLYFREGRVANLVGDDDAIRAEVRGGRLYSVELLRRRDLLIASCDCPYFTQEQDFCKHVWAVVRAAKHEGLLDDPDLPRVRKLWIEPEPIPDDDFNDFDIGADFDLDADFDIGAYPDTDEVAPEWRTVLSRLRRTRGLRLAGDPDADPDAPDAAGAAAARPDRRPRLFYAIDVEAGARGGGLDLQVVPCVRVDGGDGGDRGGGGDGGLLGSWRPLEPEKGAPPPDPQRFADGRDRLALAVLRGSGPEIDGPRMRLRPKAAAVALSALCRTGRCVLGAPAPDAPPRPLVWEEATWSFALRLGRAEGGYALEGLLRRGGEERTFADAAALLPGAVVFGERAAPVAGGDAFAWYAELRRQTPLALPRADLPELLDALLADPDHPPLDLPAELRLTTESPPPRPVLRILAADGDGGGDRAPAGRTLPCALAFDYDGREVGAGAPRAELLDLDVEGDRGRILLRDPQAEVEHRSRLLAAGFRRATRPGGYAPPGEWRVALADMQRAATELVRAGWLVEAEGKLVREAVGGSASVSSGLDWFEVDGRVDYGAQTADVIRLLAARAQGSGWVRLGDGSFGILPEEWLETFVTLAELGELGDGVLRFHRSQTGLVDALLAERDAEVRRDAAFARACRELHAFDGIRPEDPPPAFRGTLRPYQREALGWFRFLARFGFGGCLADDMGLGKTVQVLARLAAPRQSANADSSAPQSAIADSEPPQTSLVVAPRSLVHNWLDEAARFVPHLRAREHGGPGRARDPAAFAASLADCDLLVTTYGTLQRDAETFASARFDHVVLDEAQAIKNPRTKAARAARLLQARQRLALSGTPIENHLGELWSLFDFLNPGMLGSDARFEKAARKRSPSDPGSLEWIARAIRPFVLRRTKAQVAPELPERTEQTLLIDLSPRDRKLYEGLADHYRGSVLATLRSSGREGFGGAGTRILEALLRLRQAACHAGLIDPKRRRDTSAKLDVLLPRLAEIADEGGKALVFSQFTALLALVRDRLDSAGGPAYAYLDGATRDRAAAVRRFQEDPDCPLFLISLKAGGLGLNLTAADCVFLLDPWWNPAVEAQAIDRAHRIGRRKPVFAYRLVARGTVEEKILQLQERKRDLADSILRADRGPLASMTLADLELLLSV